MADHPPQLLMRLLDGQGVADSGGSPRRLRRVSIIGATAALNWAARRICADGCPIGAIWDALAHTSKTLAASWRAAVLAGSARTVPLHHEHISLRIMHRAMTPYGIW